MVWVSAIEVDKLFQCGIVRGNEFLVKLAFCWRVDDGPTWNAGLVVVVFSLFSRRSGTVLRNSHYICVCVCVGGVGGSGPPVTLLDPS